MYWRVDFVKAVLNVEASRHLLNNLTQGQVVVLDVFVVVTFVLLEVSVMAGVVADQAEVL